MEKSTDTPYTVTWDDIAAPIVFLVLLAGAVMWDTNRLFPLPASAVVHAPALADTP